MRAVLAVARMEALRLLRSRASLTLLLIAGCEFQAPQKCLRLIKVYAISFIP